MAKNKWNAKKTSVDGIVFDSGWEAERYVQLRLLQRAGDISDLMVCKGDVFKFTLHDPYTSKRPGRKTKPPTYQPDFFYYDDEGEPTWEDAKGVKTASSTLKRKIAEARYGVTIWFVFEDGRRE